MQTDILLKEKYERLKSFLNERETRIVLAADAKSLGRGGLSKVAKLSGLSRVTLNAGLKDLASTKENDVLKTGSRRPGGGRKKATEKDSALSQAIEDIVSPHTLGNPMKPLQWTSKSLRKIAAIARVHHIPFPLKI
jgi:hypothetical protein